jgi:hypothetical protein
VTEELDIPDPSDRTMQRLEAVAIFDEWVPQWREMVGPVQRDGWELGWLDLATPPAGALLADFADGEDSMEATALPWRDKGDYVLLRPEARDVWTRVLPAFPATYTVEALVLTAPADSDQGVRRWRVLTADEQPVSVTERDGSNPRPWLLRENCIYHVSHDIEGGWEVWARGEAA